MGLHSRSGFDAGPNLTGGTATDLVVRLTFDSNLQAAGLAALRAGVLEAGQRRAVSQGAILALGPDGAIRVMVAEADKPPIHFTWLQPDPDEPSLSASPEDMTKGPPYIDDPDVTPASSHGQLTICSFFHGCRRA